MGNCCGSKKNKTDFDENDLNDQVYDPSLTVKGGLLGASQNLFDDNELFDAYIDKNLEDPANHKDAVGHLTFEYFLKVYKTALIWNRVKFANKKAELIA